MTKKELHSNLTDKVSKIVSDKTFAHMLECAREEMPLGGASIDPTSIVRNEGFMRGWMECIRFLKHIGKHEAEKTPPPVQPLYPDPEKPSDLNKKK